jgi:hypothetical protein
MGALPAEALMPTRRDYQRYARKGTTAQRGYGSGHQAERERRLRLYRPGDLCAHCGLPILWPPSVVRRFTDLPHLPDRSGYLPGLAHRSCNRADNRGDGARHGNRLRGAARQWQQARRW